MSQEDLELNIGAAFGSISKIESGKTNPTKETLNKIVEVLKLNVQEAASLYDINSTSITNLIKICQVVSSSFDLEDVMQNAVNELAREFNFVGAMIAIENNGYLSFTTVNESWYTKLAFKMLGKPFRDLSYSVNNDLSNYMVKSFRDNKPYLTNDAVDVAAPAVTPKICRLLQKITNSAASLMIPLYAKNQTIGVLTITKNYQDDFSLEMPVLKAFAEHIATVIINVRDIENIKKKQF